jgi:hypothetical protein
MSLEGVSIKKLAIILIAGGVAAVFLISGFQAKNVLFPSTTTEEVQVMIKNEEGTCIVQASDNVPRNIQNCQYNVGDTISITYNPEQPAIISHKPVSQGAK